MGAAAIPLVIASTAFSMWRQQQEAQTQAAIADREIKAALRHAGYLRQTASFEAGQVRDQGARLQATAAAAQAAGGLSLTGESFLAAQAGTAEHVEQSAQQVLNNAWREIAGFEEKAVMLEWQKKEIKRQANLAMIGTVLSTGAKATSLLSSGGGGSVVEPTPAAAAGKGPGDLDMLLGG